MLPFRRKKRISNAVYVITQDKEVIRLPELNGKNIIQAVGANEPGVGFYLTDDRKLYAQGLRCKFDHSNETVQILPHLKIKSIAATNCTSSMLVLADTGLFRVRSIIDKYSEKKATIVPLPHGYSHHDIKKVDIGGVGFNDFLMVLFNDGKLYALGKNCYAGQIGKSTTSEDLMCITDDVKDVFCGGFHSSFIKTNGKLYSLGFNNDGRGGVGVTNQHLHEPREVPGMQHRALMAANGCYGTLLTKDGKIYVAGTGGSNVISGDYRLVRGTENNFIVKIVSGVNTFLALSDSGKLFVPTGVCCDDDMVEEFDLLKDKEIVDIGAAGGYNFAVMVYEK